MTLFLLSMFKTMRNGNIVGEKQRFKNKTHSYRSSFKTAFERRQNDLYEEELK